MTTPFQIKPIKGVFWRAVIQSRLATVLHGMSANMAGLHADLGTIAALNKKMTAALVSVQAQSGAQAATMMPMAALLAGQEIESGTLSNIFPNIMGAALVGGQAQAGILSATELKLVAGLLGEMEPTGDLASSAAKIVAALSGTEMPMGDLTSQIPTLTAAMSGAQTQSGELSGLFFPPSVALNAAQAQQGALTIGLSPMVAALSGEQPESGTISALMKSIATDVEATEQPQGAIAAALNMTSSALAGGQTQAGAASALLHQASALLAGQNAQSGSLTASLKQAIAALTGNVAAASPVNVKGVSSGTTSCTLPAHNVGDIIVMFAFRATNNIPPTKPAASGTTPSFTYIMNNTGTASCSSASAYFVATATNHTSGTWGSTNSLIAVVLSGQAASPIGATAEAGASGGNATAPAITPVNADGTSVFLHYFGRNGSAAPTSWSAAPAGYTQQIVQAWIALDTKNDTTADGAVTNSTAGGTGTGYDGVTIEIVAH